MRYPASIHSILKQRAASLRGPAHRGVRRHVGSARCIRIEREDRVVRCPVASRVVTGIERVLARKVLVFLNERVRGPVSGVSLDSVRAALAHTSVRSFAAASVVVECLGSGVLRVRDVVCNEVFVKGGGSD